MSNHAARRTSEAAANPIRLAAAKASPLTLAIAGLLAGLSIMDGDNALDEARRTLWLMGFAGVAREVAEHETAPCEIARAIIGLLDGQSVHAVETLLTEARYLIWMTSWAHIEGSAFAKRLADNRVSAEEGERNRLDITMGSC